MQGVLQHVLQLGQHHADKWSCKKKKKRKGTNASVFTEEKS